MTKEKRKMIRVLDVELFQRNRESILLFERDRVEQLGGIKRYLSDSKVLDIMSRTCGVLWGDGRDLYLASQQRTFEMVTHLVVTQVDDCISQAVEALATWLELKITYTRQGSTFTFRYEKPSGEFKELQIPIRQTDNQRSVH